MEIFFDHYHVSDTVWAYARLAMLRDMRILMRMGCILFYTDTDSIIFLVAKDRRAEVESILNVGSAAYGGYKFETDGGLVVFVTLGPKNYAYTTSLGLQVVK